MAVLLTNRTEARASKAFEACILTARFLAYVRATA